MRVALVNPHWTYGQSIYFGCKEAHLPLELGYAAAFLEEAGHEAKIFDGLLDDQANDALAKDVAAFTPDMTVVTTAPTYLFWRCAPPELRVPAEFLKQLGQRGGVTVAVGPHGSVTPKPALEKLGCDFIIRGECEEAILKVADAGGAAETVQGTAWISKEAGVTSNGAPLSCGFVKTPALKWPDKWIEAHGHHHHRFDVWPEGPGAEVEASRGCPYSCSFCAKLDYRDSYRRREIEPLMEEIDTLITQGVRYIYFVDEIFLPRKDLLEALTKRDVSFGIQTRIDLWTEDMLALLGQAGCVSIEAGVESLTWEGRQALNKRCKMSSDELSDRLIEARRSIPFVQANLIATADDDAEQIKFWRERLQSHGVWANDPVPLYPYPSSPDYWKLWGAPDDYAWERAHEYYLHAFQTFSDIQEEKPAPLPELEASCEGR